MTRFEAFKKTMSVKDFKNILLSSLYYNECMFCSNYDKLRSECKMPRKKYEKSNDYRKRACDIGVNEYLNEEVK